MVYIFIALIVAALDQLTKALTVSNINMNDHIDIIPGILGLTRVRNTGIAFSMLENSGWILTAVIVVLIIIVTFVLLKAKLTGFERFSLALILGGAVGNLLDRIFYGYVLDMIEVKFVRFAVFNFADCCITVGCIFFAVAYLFYHERGLEIEAQRAGLREKAEARRERIRAELEETEDDK